MIPDASKFDKGCGPRRDSPTDDILEYLVVEQSSLMESARAQNTFRTYDVTLRCLQHFRLSHQLPVQFPVPISDLALFIAYLSANGYASATASTYVAAIGYFHKLHDLQNPT